MGPVTEGGEVSERPMTEGPNPSRLRKLVGRLRDLPRLPEPEIRRNRQGKGVLLNGLATRKALYNVVAVAPPREGLSV